MAYVNVAGWKLDQVTDWLKGLDNAISPYIQSFLNNHVTGQQILSFRPDDLEHLGIFKIGHQEIILEGVEHLRNIHYELDRENLQFLAMRLSCLTHSLHNELSHSHTDSQRLSTQILADIANIVTAVKPLIAWLDRPGFSGELEYTVARSEILSLALRMATCGQRDRFAETPVTDMKDASAKLAKLADSIIQEMTDPLILQPASLDLATIKKRSSEDLGFYIVPSFRGVHQISDLKLNSAAHQCGKIEPGDEIVQINYQTVVGWDVKHVMTLFAESPTEVYLTLKKRPRHTKVYGQIYVKPYRLPSKKRMTHVHPFARRPEFHLPFRLSFQKVTVANTDKTGENSRDSRGSTSSDEEEEVTTTIQHHNLVVPAKPVHRRATITGASPLSKRPPLDIHELWHDLKLEKDSSTKQSITSVVDFEERVSSASCKTVGSDNVQKDQPPVEQVKTEMLTIKQRIELFSQGDKNEKPKVPLRSHVKPQIRINSEPIFDDNMVVEADKLIKKAEKPKSTETEKVKTGNEDDNSKGSSEERIKVQEEATLPIVSEEHGKVVETINRHLLLNYDNDAACDNEAFRISKMLESLSNSLPHSARFRKGIVIGETQSGLSTHSLPVRKGQNSNWEFDSSLSRTISRVYKEDSFFKKEENSVESSQNHQAIVSDKSTRKESSQESKPSKKNQDIHVSKSYSSCEQMQHQFDPPKNHGPILERQTLPKAAPRFIPTGSDHTRQNSATELVTSSSFVGLPPPPYNPATQVPTPPVPPPRPSLSKPPGGACYRAIMAARSIGRGSPKTQRKKNSILLSKLPYHC
ncbi:hypothetical protein AAG570_011099 [Ranatra chinensis]|uniref:Connector enhancer of kinase suppressor of ras 2 n=1 Tax=Ranatra chinensis TaxID=642074 RepID=A0ABD0YXZ6_9HEMI